MEEKKINKRIVFSGVAVLLLIAVVVGSTYAYFRAVGESVEQEITTANLKLVFDDSTEMINTELSPITTDEVLTKAAKKTFRISKEENSKDLYVKIKISDINVPEALAEYDLKWALYQDTTPITTGDFGGKTTGEIIIATNQLINSTTPTEYKLYIWINETGIEQSTMMNQRMTAKITATGTDKKENTLASVLLGENIANVTTTALTISNTSTDRGLFVQSGDVTKSEMGFPTYYFRGSATNKNEGYNPDYIMNNYVKFGKYTTTDCRK